MKKKNPSDLTKRNNDARKKEIAALERRIKNLEKAVTYWADKFYRHINK